MLRWCTVWESTGVDGMWAVYGGGIVLLWICALFLAGGEDSVSGVLRGSLKRNEGRRKKRWQRS